jgi:hypothetical protein
MVRTRAPWIVDAALNDIVVVRYSSAAKRACREAMSWLEKMTPMREVKANDD